MCAPQPATANLQRFILQDPTHIVCHFFSAKISRAGIAKSKSKKQVRWTGIAKKRDGKRGESIAIRKRNFSVTSFWGCLSLNVLYVVTGVPAPRE